MLIPCEESLGTANSLLMGFTLSLQLFHGSKKNFNKPLKNEKKISGIERLVLPFPDT